MNGVAPFQIRPMTTSDVEGVAKLQKLAFPPPFSEDLHWDIEHLLRHVEVFPTGQFVAIREDQIVGSCSNAIISEERWQGHGSWGATVGGPYIRNHSDFGSTLYGLDITVAPSSRRLGIGRAFYAARYQFVRSYSLIRYGTGCRLPDYQTHCATLGPISTEQYANMVVTRELTDRTLTPLLSYGLTFLGVIENYMEDVESGDAAALLEWLP